MDHKHVILGCGDAWTQRLKGKETANWSDFIENLNIVDSTTLSKAMIQIAKGDDTAHFRFMDVGGDALAVEGHIEVVSHRRKEYLILTALEVAYSDKTSAALAALMDSMSQSIAIHKFDTPLYANKALSNMLGYVSPSEVLSLDSVKALVHPDDWEMVSQAIENGMEGSEEHNVMRYRLLKKDGTAVWVESHGELTKWDGETVIAVIMTNITERLAVRKKQEEQQHLFETLFELGPDLCALIRMRDLQYLNVNRGFCELFDVEKDFVLSQTSAEFSVWEDVSFRGWILNELKTKQEIKNQPVLVRVDENTVLETECTFSQFDIAGERLLLITGYDVTEERKSARALQESRDAAQIANRAKSDFLANMSHELRTPLNAIMGFSDIMRSDLQQHEPENRHIEYMTDIYNSGEHLLNIINDILDLSKVEAGSVILHPAKILGADVIEQAMRLLRHRAEDGGVHLHVDVEEGIAFETDDRLFKQIILNLMSNAIKFTPRDGAVNISLKTDGNDVILQVADTGIGMSPSDIQVALSAFGQVESQRARANKGTGLGLPLVHAFTQLLKGKMTLFSEPEKGTTVNVTIPNSCEVLSVSSDEAKA